jgi:hypothetical protein
MAIEAPLSKHKKGNFKIYIAVCAALAIWFAYDGYFNQNFIKNHTSNDDKADSTLAFNRHAPYYLGGAAIVLAAYFWAIKDKKLIADESELRISSDETIKYDSIEQIDRTHFAAKGWFAVMYKDEQGKTVTKKLSDRNWDNLAAVLDQLVAKIS